MTTVFTYSNGYDYKFFKNSSYLPKFLSDGISFKNSTLEALAIQKCGTNKNCLFDVSSTGQIEMAELNRKFEETKETINLLVNEAAKQCIPMKFNFSNGNYSENVVNNYLVYYSFTCDFGFTLDGNSSIKCENGSGFGSVSKCIAKNINNGVAAQSNYSTIFLFYYAFYIIFSFS